MSSMPPASFPEPPSPFPGRSATPEAAAPLPRLDLRPLSTGELLDRVFFLYRAQPLLFWGVALVPALVSLLGGVAQLANTRGVILPSGSQPQLMIFHSGSMAALSILTSLLSIAAYALAQAATTRVVTQIYLGQPAGARAALAECLNHLLRYIGIEVWKVWSGVWLPVLLGGTGALLTRTHLRVFGGFLILLAVFSLVYGVIAYIRNVLAIPASVVEGLMVRASMRRSKVLTSQRKGRIFLLLVMLVVLYMIVGLIALPLTLLLVHVRGTMHVFGVALINQLVGFVLSLLITPVASIALCLFYLDERVRQEGFDLDFMVRGVGALAPAALPSVEPPLGSA